MKIYESSYDYSYAFPTVTLAYFLRYPNPYSKHVLSTDVISRHVDPETSRLHTTRLLLKKSKVPSGILKLIPRGLAGPEGKSQSFILEKSVVDLKEGWMETESRNMEWTGILSVVEKQVYSRWEREDKADKADKAERSDRTEGEAGEWTRCKTTVTFVSKLGQAKPVARKSEEAEQQEAPKVSWLSAWSTAGLQRTVELVGLRRTQSALVNGKEGMNVVLERLRNGGVRAVLEGMRRDRTEMMGAAAAEGGWRQVWAKGHAGDRD
ncbi:hypothetical protein DV738_g557, partial [Chaetothyriales sp. CBS 135597]